MRDGETSDVIVKLVNMLPVDVVTKMVMPDGMKDNQARLTVLTGEPADKDARPVESFISVGDGAEYKMPPYSLSVIRMKCITEKHK